MEGVEHPPSGINVSALDGIWDIWCCHLNLVISE